MTAVHCRLRRCIRNLNGACRRTKIRMRGGNCADFRPRMREQYDATTTVLCEDVNCAFYFAGVCTRKEVYVTEKGCKPKESD